MKPYPRYKPTGLPWLPSVPEHWDVVKNRSFLRESCVLFPETKAQLLSVSQYDGVTPFPEDRKERVETLEGYKVVDKNDLVMNIMLAWNGSSGVSAHQGVVSPAYAVFKILDGANPRFIHYLFRSDCICDYFKAFSTGVVDSRLRLYPQVLARMWSPLPPPPEQSRIVRYLDAKTAAIAGLIRAKEREIELLHERKQALVTEAVTGRDVSTKRPLGRDASTMRPNDDGCAVGASLPAHPSTNASGRDVSAKRPPDADGRAMGASLPDFRPSGVPWIDEIPEGWQVVKLSRRYSVQLGKMLDSKKIKGDSLVPYLRNQDVQWDNINSNDLPQMDFSGEEQVRFGVQKGDLLVCEGGEIGRCAIWESENPCCFQKALIRLRPRNPTEDSVRFMWYLMCAATANHAFDFATGKATIAHLPAEKLSASQFAFPPLPEQQRIVARLDAACSRLAAAEAAIRKQITLLQELRTRLVSDAVTGAVEIAD